MPLTTTDTIKSFELYVDDGTELSDSEELALAQKIYDDVCASCDWEILKKAATGVTSGSVPYISLPTDFGHMCENTAETDDNVENQNTFGGKVVFIGPTYTPYKVINWSDRRQYRDIDGYCYLEMSTNRLYFTKQPSAGLAYEFDYIYVPAALTLTTFMVFPERFAPVLFHGMCVDDYMIQQSDKLRSYAPENQFKYEKKLSDMKMWNAKLINF